MPYRFVRKLKQKVKNMTVVEASIVNAYLTEEATLYILFSIF